MKTNARSHRRMSITMALLVVGLLTSCSIKPHAGRADGTSNKAIIDLQKSQTAKNATETSSQRKQVVKTSRKKSEAKKKEQGNKSAASVQVASAEKGGAYPVAGSANVEEKAEPRRAGAEAVRLSERETPQRSQPYRLGYGDVIEAKFFNTPEYNESVAVRPDGYISLQRVGDIYANGKTVSELDAEITQAYTEVLQNPDVTLLVRQFGGQQCYVMGEVEKPGMVNVAKGMTLLRAIAAAGGPKKSAKLSSIILIRSQDFKTAEASRLDLSMGHLAKRMETDLTVNAYDVIYVPKTFIADVGAFMGQIYDIILPPFDAWARYEFWYKD